MRQCKTLTQDSAPQPIESVMVHSEFAGQDGSPSLGLASNSKPDALIAVQRPALAAKDADLAPLELLPHEFHLCRVRQD
eukprot:CAMPEP_0172671966 /NCGR_PEP_ID=MMETSP1074-20121228/11251_1 /TAXON_ID=2916 /ORGANISM="Ceratium fusus, Strain PA161109" /LENGTH=78 /DNA_ID=CAMNT_0013489087 /DNA_START=546 /DNA_END=782 /DNA_ORIENTATION=-